ncbi:hypothetical protein [Ascidiimonas sp. W6]
MKKAKLKNLKLSKEQISSLQQDKATGGREDTIYFTCYPKTQCYYTPLN